MLAPLTPLNPYARAATKLPSGGPGALEVAMQRNQQEDAFVKDALARQKAGEIAAAKDKAKQDAAANKKAAEIGNQQVFTPHTLAWTKSFGDMVDWHAEKARAYAEGKGGNPDVIETPEGAEYLKMQNALAQKVKVSKDIEKAYGEGMTYLTAHEQEFKPGAKERWAQRASDPAHLEDNTIPVMDASEWDIEKNDADYFGKVQKEVRAWAGPTADGGVSTGSLTRQVPDALKQLAESFTADEWAYKAHLDRYSNMEPEGQERIKALAEKNALSIPAALALDIASNLYGATEREASFSQPSAVSAGRDEEKRAADEFVQVYKNVFNQTARKYNLDTAFPEMTYDNKVSLLKENPKLAGVFMKSPTGEIVLKPGHHIIKDFNRLAVGATPKVAGSKPGSFTLGEPKQIQFAIQNEETGNIVVASGTPSEFQKGKVDLSSVLDKHQLLHDLVFPALEKYGNKITITGMEDALLENGIDIKTGQTSADNRDVTFVKPDAPSFNTPAPSPSPAATPLNFNVPKPKK